MATRSRAAIPLLQHGFRPFFLGGALWAAVSIALWALMLGGASVLPSAFDPVIWHQHEMLFGYGGAVVVGFLLTAVPNWSGRLPLRHGPLARLFALWVVGRIAVATSAVTGALAGLVLDVAFLTVAAALVGREVVVGRNWRNLPVATLLGLLAVANLLVHLEVATGSGTAAVGHRLAIAVLVTLIGMVGGRVVPSFTRNWLARRGEPILPAPFGRLDRLAILGLLAALLAWIARPDAATTGGLLGLAALLQGYRLARWRGWRTTAEPLVLILHLGYGWLPLGLALLGLQSLGWLPWPLGASHALTAGAIGTMTLAIMTRASLGHTGRALHAGRATVALYAAVVAGALLRVFGPAMPLDQTSILDLAAVLWGGGFLLFVLIYGPMLVRPAARVAS